jgi:hypothetical protein
MRDVYTPPAGRNAARRIPYTVEFTVEGNEVNWEAWAYLGGDSWTYIPGTSFTNINQVLIEDEISCFIVARMEDRLAIEDPAQTVLLGSSAPGSGPVDNDPADTKGAGGLDASDAASRPTIERNKENGDPPAKKE